MSTAKTPRYRTILLFGMPGSGKGTQGSVLGQLPGFLHVSSGDVFRKLPKNGTLGKEIEQYTSQGSLVPDDLTIRIYQRHTQILEMQEFLLPDVHTLVLDGIPRNYVQAESMAPTHEVIQIFHLVVRDKAQAAARLKDRALRENRLDDMNDAVIRRRLKLYQEETLDTLRFYDDGLVFEIDATQLPLNVLRDIVNRLSTIDSLTAAFVP